MPFNDMFKGLWNSISLFKFDQFLMTSVNIYMLTPFFIKIHLNTVFYPVFNLSNLSFAISIICTVCLSVYPPFILLTVFLIQMTYT